LIPERGLRTYLNLTRELAFTQFKLKYSGSVLGYLWSLAKPLMLFAIMYVVFSQLLRVGAGSPNFALQLLVAVVVWSFFAETTAIGLHSIVANSNLIRKAYFPRAILVWSATVTALMTFAINMGLILIVFGPIGRLDLRLETLMMIPLIVELYLVTLGASLLLATMFVFFRDVGYIWEIVTQVLFYGSGVVYPLGFLSPAFQRILVLNPMAQIIEDIRHGLVTQHVPWSATILGGAWLVPLLLALAVIVVGCWAFTRWEPRFAESM